MVLPLAYVGEDILYEKCKEIPKNEILNAKIQTFINDLSDTIKSIDIAAGLAAPQVHKNLRIFAVRMAEKSLTYTQNSPKSPERIIKGNEPFIFINPKLTFVDDATDTKMEACLSIPEYFGPVERHVSVKVNAFDREGKPFEIIATKFLARVIQHENDHLDGILWLQRIKNTKEIFYDSNKDEK